MTEYSFRPPFKRGKVLPNKEDDMLREVLLNETTDNDTEDLSRGSSSFSSCRANALSWSSSLTLAQRRRWAKLLQQRHALVPDLTLAQLPDDLVFQITSFLDAPSLLQMRCLSRKYRQMCSRNEAGWDRLCRKLWDTKIHIAEEALRLSFSTCGCNNNGNKNDYMMKAYRMSIDDARGRQFITVKELCYNPATKQGTVWSFRFKESAGSDWTLADPWYNGGPCRKMVFLRDGTVKQLCPGSSTMLRPPFFGTTLQNPLETDNVVEHLNDRSSSAAGGDNFHQQHGPQNHGFAPAAEEHYLVDPPVAMTWRFITRPMDLPTRPMGSYIRVTVGGRDVPTYAVRRSPTGNWGFVMESCWGLFASFDLPARISRPAGSTRSRSPGTVLRRTPHHGHLWLDIMVDELDFLAAADNEINIDDVMVSGEEMPGFLAQVQDRGGVDPLLFDARAINGGLFSSSTTTTTTTSTTLSPGVRAAALESDPMLPLRDDSFMMISNDVQWREAFLYNVGAQTLPEGDEATDEFDRAWGGN
ncbi:hypothetical protein ACA910_021044 [Epithemia clementina (nom. ined.)]